MADGTKFLLWLLLLSSSSLCFGSELDIQCLMNVKQSVIDTSGMLKSSWNFDDRTNGGICGFAGVECWTHGEMVLSLRLSNFGLEGPFPQGLEDCTSMIGLDLSSNDFSGPIPSDISRQVPAYLTSMNLSYNSFSGEIPESISNMAYLNSLDLHHNQLSGQIPNFHQNFPPSNFEGNQGLCGAPLDPCPRRRWRVKIRLHRINDESWIGAAVGFVAGFVVAFYFPHCFVFSERLPTYVFRI